MFKEREKRVCLHACYYLELTLVPCKTEYMHYLNKMNLCRQASLNSSSEYENSRLLPSK